MQKCLAMEINEKENLQGKEEINNSNTSKEQESANIDENKDSQSEETKDDKTEELNIEAEKKEEAVQEIETEQKKEQSVEEEKDSIEVPPEPIVKENSKEEIESSEEKVAITRKFREEQYQKLCDAVYKRRGWTKNGIPTVETVRRLGINFQDVLEVLKVNGVT